MAAAVMVCVVSSGFAQQVAEEPPKVQEIVAVERGGFVEADLGLAFIVNKLDDRRYGLAVTTALFAGYDILPILSVSVGATTVAAPVSDDSAGVAGPPSGDLLFIIPMARVQFAVLTTERHFLWLRGGGGFSIGLPQEIDDVAYGGNGPAFSASVGFERFTRLRHFSIGIEAGTLLVTKPAIGLTVFAEPLVKFTF